MGQYSRWLHYQEVDRRLRAELEELKAELNHLQHSIENHTSMRTSSPGAEAPTGEATPQMGNIIIRALVSSLNSSISTPDQTFQQGRNPAPHSTPSHTSAPNGLHEQQSATSNSTLTATSDAKQSTPGETISPALMSWGALPNFGTPEINGAAPVIEQQPETTTPHPEIVLLPEDIPAFLDEHARTEPQLKLPWWLRPATSEATAQGVADMPASTDLERIRTNKLVQRWMERRKRLSPQTSEAQKNGKQEEVADDE
jgi:hypothetical protein